MNTVNGSVMLATAHKLRSAATALLADSATQSDPRLADSLMYEANQIQKRADQITAAAKPPEPTEFGSIVRAGYDEKTDRVLWVRCPDGWHAEVGQGYHAFFAGLHDPEVLRVGPGGEYSPALQQIRDLLFRSPSGYLTNEETLAAYKDLRRGLSDLLSGQVQCNCDRPKGAEHHPNCDTNLPPDKRSGLGDPDGDSYDAGFFDGRRAMNTQTHVGITALREEAITSERKSGLDKALQLVEELAP